ncbi:unnamed protein product [Soboliphyme baturini]|uniref:FYVE-type domain-containing protein n=1 Tax=Soboliphyme baturini TaxID=241478 RepID=A0A183IBE2_9BILA|nr:unnamed protein product [Soboliphyme baturini]
MEYTDIDKVLDEFEALEGCECTLLKKRPSINKCPSEVYTTTKSERQLRANEVAPDRSDGYSEVLCQGLITSVDNEPKLTTASRVTDFNQSDGGLAMTSAPPPVAAEKEVHDDALVTVLNDEPVPSLKHALLDLLTESEMMLGKVAPVWILDRDSNVCMLCEAKFTVIKRRHHCRACGRVLCSDCCSAKARLRYMDNKEARLPIHWVIKESVSVNFASVGDQLKGEGGMSKISGTFWSLIALFSLVTEMEEASPNLAVMSQGERSSYCLSNEVARDELPSRMPAGVLKRPGTPLPDATSIQDALVKENLSVTFQVKRNLKVNVKLMKDAWNAWCFSSKGLVSTGAREVLFLLRCRDDFSLFPIVFLSFFDLLYDYCLEGHHVSSLLFLPFADLSPDDLFLKTLCAEDNTGMLFVAAPLYVIEELCIAESCSLLALLVKKQEAPWAQVLPLRLLLRLGYEYNCNLGHYAFSFCILSSGYPWPAVSIIERDCVFFKLGHTVMSLLNDFRNFSYSISRIAGCYVTLSDTSVNISFELRSYEQLKKVFDCNDEHVIAWSTDFSISADSYLVCVEDKKNGGTYRTQKLLKVGTPENGM